MVLLVLSAVSRPTPAAEAEPTKAANAADATSSYVRDYLSDPRRTGSLAGSILGGALTANPAGTIIGSVIGFFVGKNSMYDEDKARAQQANALYAKRDIVPNDAQGVPTLSFANAQGITFDTTPSSASSRPSQMSTPLAGPSGISREQILQKCSGQGISDPRLRSLCFYYQGS
jgi:hypothetical protein